MGPLRSVSTLIFLTLSITSVLAQIGTDAGRSEDEPAAITSAEKSRAVPRLVRFSGAVREGDAPRTGVVGLTFAIYADHQGGAPLWVETQNVQLDQQGHYTVLLGRTSSGGLPVKLFVTGEARWLGARVAEEGAEEQPRVALVSVPYALTSADAQTLGGRPASDFQLTRTAAQAAGDGSQAGFEPSANSGTAGFIGKFTNTVDLGNSVIFESGGNIGIGTTVPGVKLVVSGDVYVPGGWVNVDATTSTGGQYRLGGQRVLHGVGTANIFVGKNSGNLTMSGDANVGVGTSVLLSNTTGGTNTAVGNATLLNNTTGGFNTATGAYALNANTTGTNNTASGYLALSGNVGGVQNTAIGLSALSSNTTGSNNTALGYRAGTTGTSANANVTGGSNTFIGFDAGPGTSTQLTNATAIGANAVVSASNSLVLGNGANVGIGTSSPAARLHLKDAVARVLFEQTASPARTWVFGTDNSPDSFFLYDQTSAITRWVITAGGNMGVGTQTPNSRLHLRGEVARMTFDQTSVAPRSWYLGTDNSPDGFFLYDITSGATRLFVTAAGQLGIGTSTPSERLQVVGTIHSTTGGFKFPDGTTQTTAATGGGSLTLPFSGSTSSSSGAFVVTQTNSVVLQADPTFASAQTNIPAAIVGKASATSNTAAGVAGFSSNLGPAVVGWNGSTTGTQGEAQGVIGISENPIGIGVDGSANAVSGTGTGVRGWAYSANGIGVHGGNEVGGLAGKFDGQVQIQGALTLNNQIQRSGGGAVTLAGGLQVPSGGAAITGASSITGNLSVSGTLSKGGGSFKIDHPLDPANKYLYHSFVESPDMMNIYNGMVTLDAKGEAWITMPEWFQALNMDFRYQLTPIGNPGQRILYIAEEIQGNRFKIAGGKPNAKVSWQVTGVRQDAFARENRIQVEVPKPPQEQGTYLYPQGFQPKPVVAQK